MSRSWGNVRTAVGLLVPLPCPGVGGESSSALGVELKEPQGARWGDEVLTELSLVEGQRTNEKTNQQRMPGIREDLPRQGHFS